MSGTWIAATKLEKCDHCRTLYGLELHEGPPGLVSGVMGFDSQLSVDAVSGAAYAVGTLKGDTVDLTFLIPCDTLPPRIAQGLRGRLIAAGDSLYGEHWARPASGPYKVPLVFHRGAIDSAVTQQFADLRRVCS